MLELARQYDHDQDADATDDEVSSGGLKSSLPVLTLLPKAGTIVNPLHGRPTPGNPMGVMPAKYDSRSRFFLQTERLANKQAVRLHVGKQQKSLLQDNNDRALEDNKEAIAVEDEDLPTTFGRGDVARRIKAIEALNIHSLAFAASEIETEERNRQQRAAQVISNEEAFGLQALAAALEQHPRVPREPKLEPSSPRVKLEHASADTSATLYPPAPMQELDGEQGRTAKEPQATAASYSVHGPLVSTPVHGRHPTTLAGPLRTRTISDPSASTAPSQLSGRQRGRSLIGHTDNAGHMPLVGKSSPSSHIEINPQLATIPEAPRQGHSRQNSSSTGRADRPFWRNILADSDTRQNGTPSQGPANEEAYRRRSETHASPRHQLGHERDQSGPLAHIVESNPFRSLRSPAQLHETWPPPPPPPHGPPIYYAVPSYVPYVVYGPPPPHHSTTQAPGSAPPPPPHGPPVFFGPPPPPQFGPPTGPQQQPYPWYRQ